MVSAQSSLISLDPVDEMTFDLKTLISSSISVFDVRLEMAIDEEQALLTELHL